MKLFGKGSIERLLMDNGGGGGQKEDCKLSQN